MKVVLVPHQHHHHHHHQQDQQQQQQSQQQQSRNYAYRNYQNRHHHRHQSDDKRTCTAAAHQMHNEKVHKFMKKLYKVERKLSKYRLDKSASSKSDSSSSSSGSSRSPRSRSRSRNRNRTRYQQQQQQQQQQHHHHHHHHHHHSNWHRARSRFGPARRLSHSSAASSSSPNSRSPSPAPEHQHCETARPGPASVGHHLSRSSHRRRHRPRRHNTRDRMHKLMKKIYKVERKLSKYNLDKSASSKSDSSSSASGSTRSRSRSRSRNKRMRYHHHNRHHATRSSRIGGFRYRRRSCCSSTGSSSTSSSRSSRSPSLGEHGEPSRLCLPDNQREKSTAERNDEQSYADLEVEENPGAKLTAFNPMGMEVDVQLAEERAEERIDEIAEGPELNEALAENWTKVIKKGLTTETKMSLLKKYPVSKNCLLLKGPKINEEILPVATKASVKRDSAQMNQQLQIGTALTALGKAITDMSNKYETEADANIMESLNDAALIILHVHRNMTKSRQALVASELKKKVRPVVEICEADEFLFGRDFGDKVKRNKGFKKSRKYAKSQYFDNRKDKTKKCTKQDDKSSHVKSLKETDSQLKL